MNTKCFLALRIAVVAYRRTFTAGLKNAAATGRQYQEKQK